MSISNRVRFEVLKRDKFTCQYCGKSGVELEVDHIKPKSKGGTDDIGNLITACIECNRGKSNIEVIPIGYEVVREPKTKRLNLLVRPSIFKAFKDLAQEKGISVNDYINELLEREVDLI